MSILGWLKWKWWASATNLPAKRFRVDYTIGTCRNTRKYAPRSRVNNLMFLYYILILPSSWSSRGKPFLYNIIILVVYYERPIGFPKCQFHSEKSTRKSYNNIIILIYYKSNICYKIKYYFTTRGQVNIEKSYHPIYVPSENKLKSKKKYITRVFITLSQNACAKT